MHPGLNLPPLFSYYLYTPPPFLLSVPPPSFLNTPYLPVPPPIIMQVPPPPILNGLCRPLTNCLTAFNAPSPSSSIRVIKLPRKISHNPPPSPTRLVSTFYKPGILKNTIFPGLGSIIFKKN